MSLLSDLKELDDPEACIRGTLMIPISRGTLKQIIASLVDGPWIVGNAEGTKWRTWNSGPDWTSDRDRAVRYARREDAEKVHAEDEDAWRVVRYADQG